MLFYQAQSVIQPAGPAAARIAELWWILFGSFAVVYGLIVGLLLYAVFRRRQSEPDLSAAAEARARRWIIVGGAILPGVILVALFGYTLNVTRALMEQPDATIEIEVIGRQWWWEVRYVTGRNSVVTANEIHIPVGRTARIRVRSVDVIHSFWVPSLQGKVDLVPGRMNVTWLRAEKPGVYRGQCAEYCGLQHARMALDVVAEPEDEFAAWLAQQAAPATLSSDSVVQHGFAVFVRAPCAGCHTIRGLSALDARGPDLTHVGGRLSLAAGTLPNTKGHLGGWISNPQAFKAGTAMPNSALPSGDFTALIDFLWSLK